MEYREPTGNNRVRAIKRITYETGPLKSKSDDVELGTLPMEMLEMWDTSEHVHEDGSLMLSGLDDETREQIEAAFEPAPINEIAERIAETTAARGVDSYAVNEWGLTAAEWGEMTGRDRSTVARNVRRAE